MKQNQGAIKEFKSYLSVFRLENTINITLRNMKTLKNVVTYRKEYQKDLKTNYLSGVEGEKAKTTFKIEVIFA